MAASPDIIGMEYIQSKYLSVIDCHTAIALGCKEPRSCHSIQQILLWKCDTVLNDLIPYNNHFVQIFMIIFSDNHSFSPGVFLYKLNFYKSYFTHHDIFLIVFTDNFKPDSPVHTDRVIHLLHGKGYFSITLPLPKPL